MILADETGVEAARRLTDTPLGGTVWSGYSGQKHLTEKPRTGEVGAWLPPFQSLSVFGLGPFLSFWSLCALCYG